MRTTTFTVSAVSLVFTLTCAASAIEADQSKRPRNDPFDDIAGGFSIGEVVEIAGKGAAAFAMAKEAYAEFSREIEAARKAFWAQYPNGPKRAQAEAEFARQLYSKDIQYFFMTRIDGSCRGGARPEHPNMMSAMMHAAGGQVDGGLAGGTASGFCAWVRAARGLDPIAATKLPEYARYQRARDWAELVRAGKVAFASPYDLLKSKEPQWYVIGLIWGRNEYGINRDALTEGVFPDVLQRTKATFDTLAKTHGRERVLGIARTVMEAPKRPPDPKIVNDGLMDTGFLHLADPKGIGCMSLYAYVDECFFELLLPRTEPVAALAPVKHSGRGAARGAASPVMPPATTPPVPAAPPAPTASDAPPAPAVRPATTTPPATKPIETPAATQEKSNTDVTTKSNAILADLKKKAEAQQAQAAAASQAASQAAAQPPGASAGPAWQPCGGELKSGASQTVVPVEFVNSSKQPRKLYWFDFAGAKVVAGTLQPGQRAPMQTYTTHAWMVADNLDKCLGTLVISKAGSIEIR